MSYKTVSKIFTVFLIVLMPFIMLAGVSATVGKGGILNDLYDSLAEIEDLEKRNLLHSPPPSTTRIALREIELVHNSEGLRNYIKEVEQDKSGLIIFGFLTAVWIIAFITRKHFKKSSGNQQMIKTQVIFKE